MDDPHSMMSIRRSLAGVWKAEMLKTARPVQVQAEKEVKRACAVRDEHCFSVACGLGWAQVQRKL
jgi:hypothetical protein